MNRFIGLGLFCVAAFAYGDDVTFRDVSQKIFQKSCVECHNDDKRRGDLSLESYAAVMERAADKIVVPKHPEESVIVSKVESGDMPKFGDPLTAEEITLLKNWIAAGAPDTPKTDALSLKSVKPNVGPTTGGTVVTLEGTAFGTVKKVSFGEESCDGLKIVDETHLECRTPPAKDEGPVKVTVDSGAEVAVGENLFRYKLPLGPTYRAIFSNIFLPKCVACHSGQNPPGRLNLSDYDKMMSLRRAVIPGDARRSRIPRKTTRGEMPKDGPPLTGAENGALIDWINAGAARD